VNFAKLPRLAAEGLSYLITSRLVIRGLAVQLWDKLAALSDSKVDYYLLYVSTVFVILTTAAYCLSACRRSPNNQYEVRRVETIQRLARAP
jgi:hypothetical protein